MTNSNSNNTFIVTSSNTSLTVNSIPGPVFQPMTAKFTHQSRQQYQGNSYVVWEPVWIEPSDWKPKKQGKRSYKPRKRIKPRASVQHFPRNPVDEKFEPFRNLIHYTDAQDMYVGCCGRIQILDGYDVRISLPNGIEVCVDESGDYFVDKQFWGRTGQVDIRAGEASVVVLPDGTTIDVKPTGHYQIDDRNSKPVYKSDNVREYSKPLAASDMLEEFIQYLAQIGVSKLELNEISIADYMKWLLWHTAMAEGVETGPAPQLSYMPTQTVAVNIQNKELVHESI